MKFPNTLTWCGKLEEAAQNANVILNKVSEDEDGYCFMLTNSDTSSRLYRFDYYENAMTFSHCIAHAV